MSGLAELLRVAGIADDTGRNLPERDETLREQQRALVEGRQRAQMFPVGTSELPLPRGLARVTTRRGVFHYDPRSVSAEEIERASAGGRENEVLGLGPASKADVAELAQRGEPVATLVEQTPAGVEVKGALVTPSTEAATRREMQARRAKGHEVKLRPVGDVLAERVKTRAPSSGGLAALLAATGVAEAPAPGYLEGLTNTAGRGARQAGNAIDAATLAVGVGLANDAEREPARVAEERSGDPRPSRANFVRYGKRAEEVFRISVEKWQAREGARAERLRNNARFAEEMRGDSLPALVGAIGRRQTEMAELPQSAAMQEWDRADGLAEAVGVLARNPVEVVSNLAVQGVTGGAPSLALGAAGSVAGPVGTMGGAGLGSFITEYGNKVVEELGAAGADFQKPETVAAILRDSEKMARVRNKAMARGVPVAFLDALSAGIAGKVVTGPARTIGKKLLHGAAEVGTQAPLSGAGEAAGSLAAGDAVSGKEVLAESLGELGGGAVEIGTGSARSKVLGESSAAQTVGGERAEETGPAVASIGQGNRANSANLVPDGAMERTAEETAAKASATPEIAQPEMAPGEPVVVTEFAEKKPKLGKPAETLAEAINRRPDEDFKPDLATLEGRDIDLIGQIARYAGESRRAEEDFPALAERLTTKLGPRVQAYLAPVWEVVGEGRPVKDFVAANNPIEVENGWKRAAKWGRLFWEGAADVTRRAGAHSLANAIDTHVDFAERNLAKAWAPIKPAVEKMRGVAGLVNRGRVKAINDEFAAFYRARENGRLEEAQQVLAIAHPETRRLIGAVQQMMVYTGQENRRLGVRVRDPNTGEIRGIGYLGAEAFPRMLKDDVLEVLRDPSSDPKKWEQMRAELLANGNAQSLGGAGKLLAQAVPDESSSDYFGSMEKARAARLPEDWYEYDFWKVVPRYVQSWAERTAQIEAFGQKLAATDRDAFDVAAEATRNPEAQRYIHAAQEHAYRVNRMDRTARHVIGNVTTAATALFLGNPYSSMRNLVGGLAQTVNQYGLGRTLGALSGAWKAIPDAEAAGVLKADVADMLFHDDATPPLRKLTNLTLKAGGFNAAENFVRAHSYLTAKTFLRDALGSLSADPGSVRSLQAQAFFKRYGFEAEKLARESMHGPETERFLRKSVREAQGGYRYDQVPLFADGPLGRFLLQFARYGTQASRFHAEQLVKPAVVGTEVPIEVNGKQVVRRMRTLLPLLRSPVVALAAGMTTYALREALFGIGRNDATWDEVWKTLDEDDQRGLELALNRMMGDVVMGGTMGAVTDYASMLRDATARGRYKNPVEPPAAALLKETGALAYKLARQGTLSARDYREYVSRMLTAYRYGTAMAYRFANAMGADWAAAKRHQAELDKRFARAVGRRFGEELNYDQPGASGGLPRVTENTPIFDTLEDALLAGNAGQVRALTRQYVAKGRTEAEREDRRRRLRASVLGRQPMKPGGQSGPEDRAMFTLWARKRLPAQDWRRIRDIQWRWFETGRRAGIFTMEDVATYTVP